ncbi:MAG TPA: MFS transporter [Micromonosporaceae bacterium]
MYLSLRDQPAADQPGSTSQVAPKVARTVVLLGIVSLLTDVSSEMVSAVLPVYLTVQVGLGVLAYGFIDGLYQGVSATVRIVGGYTGDRSGRPKWVATVGYGVSALSRLGLLLAHGFGAISAVVTADRLGKGLRTAPRDALIADASPSQALGRAFGVHRALDTVGAAAGPVLAFALLAAVPGGYDSVFVVSFAFALVGVAVLVLLVPDRRTRPAGPRLSPRQLARAVTARVLRRPMLAVAVLGLLTVGDGFLYLSLQQRESFDPAWFPLLYVGTNLVYLILAIPIGRLADRLGRATVFLAGHVVLLAAYLVGAGPFGGVAATALTLVLLGTFYACTDGVLAALVSRLVPAQVRGSGIASAQTVVALARFGSSVAFGAIWYTIGRTPALLIMAVALAAALPFVAWLLRPADRVAVAA